MQITLDIPDELAAAIQAKGYDLDVYVRGLMEEGMTLGAVEKSRKRSVAEAVDGIRELRKGNRLDGLRVKDLIDEGRRF